MSKRVQIVEVGLRDGLQAEKIALTVEDRSHLAKLLLKSGIKRIELGSFVRPDWVPQMAGSDQVIKKVMGWAKRQKLAASFSALVPNEKGLELALQSGIPEIAIFASASEGFSFANLNASRKDVTQRLRRVGAEAKRHGLKVRGYLSVVWGCPFDGPVPLREVQRAVDDLVESGCYEISLGDTIGIATPGDVDKVLKSLLRHYPARFFAGHFHDTRGQAVANVLRALDLGLRTFDASFAGLGGCPYAPSSTGNVATEELVYMLEGLGYHTGIRLPLLFKAGQAFQNLSGRSLPSRLFRAQLPNWKSKAARLE